MINKLINKFYDKKFLVFCIIGAVNTILAQLIYMVLVALNWCKPGTASVYGDVLTIAVSYVLNMKLTYHEKLSLKSALSFPVSYIPGTIINMLIVIIVVNILHFPKIFAKLLSLPITIPLNYLCVSLIVKLTKNKKVGEQGVK
ncbi:MAG: GtrA family protein [Erysipelotrichaceae bacterium]|nr:GtrA family protein [Erysipelotrichaceae bacterium]MDY5252433.1 GtrA family protein [Erysipelotrichaceae bacterium]